MEIFMLTAVGITVSVALMTNKKREPLHLSFAALCLAISFHKGGIFFNPFFHGDTLPQGVPLWHLVERLGFLAIPPLTIKFSRDFCEEQTLLKKRDIRTTALFSAGLAAILFTPFAGWKYLGPFMDLYGETVLILSYLSLIAFAKRRATGVEKKRIVYLIIACTAAIATYSIPPLFNLVVAGMLYFIMIMITHPHLTELHDLMTRALVILIVTLFTTIVF